MKRFTETTKWQESWFLELSPKHKMMWMWLCDHCDNAGVIEISWRYLAFESSESYNETDISVFGDRLQKIGQNKWWIRKFVDFQFGQLCRASKVHAHVCRLLEKHDLLDRFKVVEHSDKIKAIRARITDTFRYDVYAMDQYRCQWCGAQGTGDTLTLDHVIGLDAGGTNEIKNVVTSCRDCNSEKSRSTPLEFKLLRQESILPRLSKILDSLSKDLYSPKEKEKEKEQEKEPDKKDKTGLIDLLGKMYHRRPGTQWSFRELRVLREVERRPDCLAEGMEIHRFYASGYKYKRQDIQTLLNNWAGELDRARNAAPSSGRKLTGDRFRDETPLTAAQAFGEKPCK